MNDIENVYLYDIDDLKGLAQAHLLNRMQESQKAHAIVGEEVERFGLWLKQIEMNPLITQIRENLEAGCVSGTDSSKRRSRSSKGRTRKVSSDSSTPLTRSIINKIIHPHLVMIKKNGSPATLGLIRRPFAHRVRRMKKKWTVGTRGSKLALVPHESP